MTDSEIQRLERAIERQADRTARALDGFGAQLTEVREHVVAVETRIEERMRRCDSHGRRLDALEERREVTGVGPAPREASGTITLDQASVRVILWILAALLLGGGAGATGWAAVFGAPSPPPAIGAPQ